MPAYAPGDADVGPGEHGRVPVLVVDDQEAFRSVLIELVTATDGFGLVGEVASGEAALSAVDELSPRLVIMDKRLPDMSGIEVTELLTSRHPKVMVLLTSVEEPPDPTVMRSCGAAAFVRKHELSPAVLQEAWRRYGA